MICLKGVRVIQFIESKDLQATLDGLTKELWIVQSVNEHQRVDEDSAPRYYVLAREF